MRRYFFFLALFLSLNSYAVPAKIIYYRFVGEYRNEKPYQIDVDLAQDSIKTIKEKLVSERAQEPHCESTLCPCSQAVIDSDLVVIGYGEGISTDYFAATRNSNQTIPLVQVLDAMPANQEGKMWYFTFVDAKLSHYVTTPTQLEWFSPFSGLANIGKQKLRYFE